MAITFGKPLSLGTGDSPSIAVNDQSIAVTVYTEGSSIVYRAGTVDKNGKTLHLADKKPLAAGAYPFIAINNNNLVVCVFERNDKEVYSIAFDTAEKWAARRRRALHPRRQVSLPFDDAPPGMTPCLGHPWRIGPWQLAAKQSPVRFRRSTRCPRPSLAWRFSTDPSHGGR